MVLTDRWERLRSVPEQRPYWGSQHRFNTLPAGRRSGKTVLAKRKLVKRALGAQTPWPDPRFFAAAPTRDQAKRIYWADLKAMLPPDLVVYVSETELRINLVNGAELWVVGMDKPQRIEGPPWDGGVLDEYANMKSSAWPQNVRPALSDREGWCDFIGVPEGRNHYYDLHRDAQAHLAEHGPESEWGAFTWKSSAVLPAHEIESAKRDLDELTFQQEYEASFINFEGRAYYPFTEDEHCRKLSYNKKQPLIFCFDFNVAPGVAVVAQEQTLPGGKSGTGFIGEVYIPRNSNTPAVCRKLVEDWGAHEGPVKVYGDASGGAGGSAKVMGSDWDLVAEELKPAFKDRVSFRVPSANPAERARLNAVNTRIKAGNGKVHLMVDPSKAPHLVRDFEGVRLLAGGSGELDKKADLGLTHLSDAAGYYISHEFPTSDRRLRIKKLQGV